MCRITQKTNRIKRSNGSFSHLPTRSLSFTSFMPVGATIWAETVERFMQYMKLKLKDSLTEAEYSEVHQAILHQEICPSMRLIWSAGEACEATNVCAYNCAYIAPVSWRDLSEIMYVSMCGAGCGFAVEPHNVEQFPRIKEQTGKPIRWTTKLRIVCVYKITNKSKIYQ